jgi:2-oxoglutarate ferredoxin oxidoreductase subunit alpha
LLRLISLWPFPDDLIEQIATDVGTFIVAEMNLGQISREVQRVIGRPVKGVFHAGGEMIPPDPILSAIQEAAA